MVNKTDHAFGSAAANHDQQPITEANIQTEVLLGMVMILILKLLKNKKKKTRKQEKNTYNTFKHNKVILDTILRTFDPHGSTSSHVTFNFET